MKFRITQNTLNQALKATTPLAGIAAKEVMLPVLGSVLLDANGDHLSITATDLTTAITINCEAEILETGSICCPAQIIAKLVTLLPDGGVILIHTDKHANLIMECEGNTAQIKGISSEEFVIPPHAPEADTYSFNGGVLHQMLSNVVICTAQEDSRPVLQAVNFVINPDGLTVAGADGYRLGVARNTTIFGDPMMVNLPNYAVNLLLKIMPVEEDVTFSHDGNRFYLQFSGGEISIAGNEGTFPDYKKIIPQSSPTFAKIMSKEMAKAIKITELFAKDAANIMRLSISEYRGIEVNGKSQDKGDNATILDGNIKGEIEMSLNYSFLLGIFGLPFEQMVIEFTTPTAPIAIYPPDMRDEVLFVVMPMSK